MGNEYYEKLYFFGYNSYYFLFLRKLQRDRDKLRERSICWFTPHMITVTESGCSKARNHSFFLVSHMCARVQGSVYLGHPPLFSQAY